MNVGCSPSLLGYERNKVEIVMKESLISFLRHNLIPNNQIRPMLFELFYLFLLPTIPLELVFLSLVFLLARITLLFPKKLLAFDLIRWKYHWKKLSQNLQSRRSCLHSNVFSNKSVPTLNINKNMKEFAVSRHKLTENQLFPTVTI